MFRNYILIALRNLRNNRLYAFLNIAGLAVGLACGVLVLLWVADELKYDKFHTNLPNIYQIKQNQTQGGVTHTFDALPGPLGPALVAEMPEIRRACRSNWPSRQLVAVGDKAVYERGLYAEPDFFNIFTFPTLKGDPIAALRDPDAIVISERTAKKFFGNEDPLGKIIRHGNVRDLRVAAVIADVPENSSIVFDIVLPFGIFEQMNQGWIKTWNNNSIPVWAELAPGADLAALNSKLENYIQSKDEGAAAHIFAYPMSRLRLHSRFENGRPSGGRITMVWGLVIIGGFVLLIACVNFMNLSTARSERRAREVGVRKVAGAHRSLLIGQFLSEAMVMALLGLTFAVVLVWFSLPAFNRFFEKTVALDFSNWKLWSGVLALGLLTGLISGSYPAFFLSKFQPARVLKNTVFTGRNSGLLRKTLVGFQFVISIVLIISTIVIHRQLQHAQARPIGYDQTNLLRIPARGDLSEKFGPLKSELLNVPGVKNVAGGSNDLTLFGSNTSGIQWAGKTEDQDFLIGITWATADWVETTGMRLAAGRDFLPNAPADKLTCLLNQAAVRKMGLQEPIIGSTITHDTTYTVIGILEDFLYNDPIATPEPLVVYHSEENDALGSFFVKIENNADWKNTIAGVEQAVRKVSPGLPFEFKFVKDEYQKYFDEVRSVGQMANVFGGIAIFIACLGLFGLSSFVAERRSKEIGVRKVLGASVAQICYTVSGEFIRPIVVAFVLAAPLAGFLMEKLLSTLEYRVGLAWWMFAAAGFGALAIAFLTVGFQSVKAALTNPVKSLRSE
jgi:putative ABC transport system permease protein